jgi:hypothetical protein
MTSRDTPANRSVFGTHGSKTSENDDSPKTIYTVATEHAPAGRVFEDSLRGTLFWETDSHIKSQDNSTGDGANGVEYRLGGKPFGVEWLSQTRVPFCRTRGLRNPLNGNKEVKVARDGIELEHGIGKRLVGLFNH